MKPIIYDCNISEMSDENLKTMFKQVMTNLVVVFKNQKLSVEEELRICQVAGNIMPTYGRFQEISAANGIMRVTGKKDKKGNEGLFGHKETLDWHANQPSNIDRKPVIWIYALNGSVGSRTSWLDMVSAYNDLPEDIKEQIEDIRMHCGYEAGRYSTSPYFHEHINKENKVKLVYTNPEGLKGLMFPYYQVFEFDGKRESEFKYLTKLLWDHCVNEKYMYHHDWNNGDIVLSDQWLTLHKRWAFEDMENRLLHRIAFDYDNIYTSQTAVA
jgi:taurine dioxygenase